MTDMIFLISVSPFESFEVARLSRFDDWKLKSHTDSHPLRAGSPLEHRPEEPVPKAQVNALRNAKWSSNDGMILTNTHQHTCRKLRNGNSTQFYQMAKDICSDGKDSLCDLPAVFVASFASGPTRRPFATDGHHSHAGWGHSASSNLHEFHILLKKNKDVVISHHFSRFFMAESKFVNANRQRRIRRQLGQLSSLNNKTCTAQRVFVVVVGFHISLFSTGPFWVSGTETSC